MWENKREGEKISNYSNENYLNFRNEYWRKDDITDSINSLGNFTLTKEEEKKEEIKNSYDISNYEEIRNIIDFIADEELRRLQKNERENLRDDYMGLDNYDNPNNVDLKVLVKQMIELKNSILKLKIKIKYYKKYELEIRYRKKHKLYIERFQIKLNNTKNQLKSMRKEAKENYGYNGKSYEKDKKYIMKIMTIKIMTIKIVIMNIIVMMKIKT